MNFKFRCRKYDLQSELQNIIGISSSKNKDEIYSCCYLLQTSSSDLLMATASRNLSVQTNIKIDGGTLFTENETNKANGKPALATNADKLLALCKKLPDKIIEVEYVADKFQTIIRCDSSRFILGCLDHKLFPALGTELNTSNTYKIPYRFFLDSIKYCLDLISEKEVPLIYYCGILVILNDKILEIVATDGVRMAVSLTTLETDVKFKVILPKKILVELVAVLENMQIPSINFVLEDNGAIFKFGKYTYRTGILFGSFPNYRVVFDDVRQNNDVVFRINRSKLETALDRCLVFVDKDQAFGVDFVFGEKELRLSTSNTKGDSSFEIIEAECPQPVETRMNARFILEYLKTISKDDTVDFFFNTKRHYNAILMRNPSDRQYFYVISPMNKI